MLSQSTRDLNLLLDKTTYMECLITITDFKLYLHHTKVHPLDFLQFNNKEDSQEWEKIDCHLLIQTELVERLLDFQITVYLAFLEQTKLVLFQQDPASNNNNSAILLEANNLSFSLQLKDLAYIVMTLLLALLIYLDLVVKM